MVKLVALKSLQNPVLMMMRFPIHDCATSGHCKQPPSVVVVLPPKSIAAASSAALYESTVGAMRE